MTKVKTERRPGWHNPAPDASPSRMTTGESYTASISAADRYPKPLRYRLVDLLGDEGISEDQVEAIRVVLNFVCAKMGKEALAEAHQEIEKLQHKLDEAGERETRYRNGLSLLLHADPEAEIAAKALYGEAYTGPVEEVPPAASDGEAVPEDIWRADDSTGAQEAEAATHE